jgi:hypothetical protein
MFRGVVLLAAGGDWTSFIIPFVFIVIYVVNYLISSSKPNTPPGRNNPQRRPPGKGERPLRPPQTAGTPPANPSPLNAEIEQFLKRANDRRGDRSRRVPTAKGPPKPPPREQPVDVHPIEHRELSSVSASVEKHLANRGFTQRAEHLADDIVRADQQMEQHLQKSFDRQVGTLGDSAPKSSGTPATDAEPVADRAEPSAAAAALARSLADPKNLRQAVILSEILQRPEHRW